MGLGFYNSNTQRELGKKGGAKNKGYKWYSDGNDNFKYTTKEQEELSFEDFLKQNPNYKSGRLKREFKERPKAKGKRTMTDGIRNVMLPEVEAIEFLKQNPEYRYGRTNFVNNKKKKI